MRGLVNQDRGHRVRKLEWCRHLIQPSRFHKGVDLSRDQVRIHEDQVARIDLSETNVDAEELFGESNPGRPHLDLDRDVLVDQAGNLVEGLADRQGHLLRGRGRGQSLHEPLVNHLRRVDHAEGRIPREDLRSRIQGISVLLYLLERRVSHQLVPDVPRQEVIDASPEALPIGTEGVIRLVWPSRWVDVGHHFFRKIGRVSQPKRQIKLG